MNWVAREATDTLTYSRSGRFSSSFLISVNIMHESFETPASLSGETRDAPEVLTSFSLDLGSPVVNAPFFTDSLYNARGFERGFRVSRSSCMFAENMEAEVVPVLVRGDDRGHSFARKMFLPRLVFTHKKNCLSYIIGGVTICHNLRKQCTIIKSDFLF